jgi:hypothetical protein
MQDALSKAIRGHMKKSRPPALDGHDEMLEKQALETAKLRAARDERRAVNSDPGPKRYRLGPENPDGTMAIDVADVGTEDWRQREMCHSPQQAQKRLQQLNDEAKSTKPAPSSRSRNR